MSSKRSLVPSCVLGGALIALVLPGIATAMPSYPPVTQSRLDHAGSSDGWLMFNRDYTGDDYAPYTAINTGNVANLKTVWTSPKVNIPHGFENAPIVNGDYMFVTTPLDHIMAFDARTGKLLWKHTYKLAADATKTICCDVNNRGVAAYDDMVFMATIDNHVVAYEAKTGKVAWNVALNKPGVGYSIDQAPLIVDGRVIVGVGGGEYGARGFIAALDAKTGKVDWKLHTIPSPAEAGGKTWPAGAYKHGGGSPWMTGTYDPATKSLFWGVGNPGPWLASTRPGHNLYSDSLLAIDPATGKIKWHYQYTRNDTWDYDGVNTPMLSDLTYQGKPYKAIVEANRNGYFYAIDRVTGKLIYAKPFIHDTSITGISADGHAVNNPANQPGLDKQITTCPSFLGGKNWWAAAVDPKTNMAYVPTLHACMTMKGVPTSYAAGLPYLGETFKMIPDPTSPDIGSVQAIDLSTGKQVWQYKTKAPWNGGVTATAGGVVFSGGTDGKLYAFDAMSGKILWTSPDLGSPIVAAPVSYKVDGKQYVAVWSGWGGVWPLWSGKLGTALAKAPTGGQLHVFALNG